MIASGFFVLLFIFNLCFYLNKFGGYDQGEATNVLCCFIY